jgi:hypothetical protein
MWPYFQKKFEKKGFRLAERGELGWIHFFSKNKVTSLAELRKQKLCMSTDDQLNSTIVNKLNIQGVPLAIPEIDAALTSGKINACFNSPLGVIALQWHTKVKYMSSMPMVYALGATVFSLDLKRYRPKIRRSSKRSRSEAKISARRFARPTRTPQGAKPYHVCRPAAGDDRELTKIAADVQSEPPVRVPKEELAMVITYRDEYRAKHPAPAAVAQSARACYARPRTTLVSNVTAISRLAPVVLFVNLIARAGNGA